MRALGSRRGGGRCARLVARPITGSCRGTCRQRSDSETSQSGRLVPVRTNSASSEKKRCRPAGRAGVGRTGHFTPAARKPADPACKHKAFRGATGQPGQVGAKGPSDFRRRVLATGGAGSVKMRPRKVRANQMPRYGGRLRLVPALQERFRRGERRICGDEAACWWLIYDSEFFFLIVTFW